MKKHELLTHTPLDVALRASQTPIGPAPSLAPKVAAKPAPPAPDLAAVLAARKKE